jgi:hypothetical protein
MADRAVFTPDQLADRWQVSRDLIYRYIAAGTLRTLPVPPGTRRPTYRIPADAVVAMEAGSPSAETPAPGRRKRRCKTDRPGYIRYFSGGDAAGRTA